MQYFLLCSEFFCFRLGIFWEWSVVGSSPATLSMPTRSPAENDRAVVVAAKARKLPKRREKKRSGQSVGEEKNGD